MAWSTNADLVKGNDMWLYLIDLSGGTMTSGMVEDAKVLAYSQSCSFEINSDTLDVTTKLSCRWSAVMQGNASYTADAPGYWLGSEGQRVVWGEEAIVYLNLGISEESLAFYSGNHPENCNPNGQTIVTKMIVEKDGITATFNITIDITAAAAAR